MWREKSFERQNSGFRKIHNLIDLTFFMKVVNNE